MGPGALNHNQPGAPVKGRYVVSSLANHGDPNAPKIIYVRGIVDGNQTPDGRILGEQDYAPGYDLTKYMSCFGPEGKSWSDQIFDALSSVTSNHLWIDHVDLTDVRFPDVDAPVGFLGKHANRHDGLLDLKDGTDYVTISNSKLHDHDKTMLLGSGDEHVDKDGGKLRVSYFGNLMENIQQRGPRVRFGQVHVVNNYFVGSPDDPRYPMVSEARGGSSYFLGAGYESRIFSEYNAFDYTGPGADGSITESSYNGHRFSDTGSWFNGAEADLNTVAQGSFERHKAEALAEAQESGTVAPDWTAQDFTADVGWNPADVYSYKPFTTPESVRNHALHFTGPGVLRVADPAS